MWEVQHTRTFGGKRRYKLDHWFKTKAEARTHAESVRRRNFLARVVPSPKGAIYKWLVYTSFK